MVQDRCIVSVKVELEVVCALTNCYVANDLGGPIIPQTTQILEFLSLFISL